MRANIRGGGGDTQKCTIEVEVDGMADVEVRGDMGYIRTLSGSPARWRRFECTSAVPLNPSDFRFKGVDGRGEIGLIRQPGAGSAAVVRINDSKGGREGYTFDLEWRGGSGYYSNSDPYYRGNDPYYRGNDPYYSGNDPYYGGNDPYYGNDRRNTRNRSVFGGYGDANQAVNACQSEVRAEARRQYNVRNPRFYGADIQDARGNRDRVVGTFEGNRGEVYDFSCTINMNNGRVRNVDVRRR